MEKKSGWQQPPLHVENPQRCLHIGAVFADLASRDHIDGDEWVCVCGKVFVVVSNGGLDKHLVPKES